MTKSRSKYKRTETAVSIRVMGRADAVADTVKSLKNTFEVVAISKPYINSPSDAIRVYITIWHSR